MVNLQVHGAWIPFLVANILRKLHNMNNASPSRKYRSNPEGGKKKNKALLANKESLKASEVEYRSDGCGSGTVPGSLCLAARGKQQPQRHMSTAWHSST